jgi:hypothetical protein
VLSTANNRIGNLGTYRQGQKTCLNRAQGPWATLSFASEHWRVFKEEQTFLQHATTQITLIRVRRRRSSRGPAVLYGSATVTVIVSQRKLLDVTRHWIRVVAEDECPGR